MQKFLTTGVVLIVLAGCSGAALRGNLPPVKTVDKTIDTVTENSGDVGCFLVKVTAVDGGGKGIAPPNIFFRLLDNRGMEIDVSTSNDAGLALFSQIPAGIYTVLNDPLPGWAHVTASALIVTVAAGSCAAPPVLITALYGRTAEEATFAVSITNHRASAAPGEILTYSVTVQNTSGVAGETTPVVVTFSPAQFLAGNSVAVGNGGSFDPKSGQVRWPAQAVSGWGSALLLLEVTLSPSATDGKILTAFAQVDLHSASHTIMIEGAAPPPPPLPSPLSLQLTNDVEPSVIVPHGAPVTFTVTLEDFSSSADTSIATVATSDTPASSVPVALTLPPALTVVSAPGGTIDGSEIAWTVPLVAPGGTVTLTASARLTQTLPQGTVLTAVAESSGVAPAIATVTVASPSSGNGCIAVQTVLVDWDGVVLPWHDPDSLPPRFSFIRDPDAPTTSETQVSDIEGNAQFFDVPPGPHTVTETLPSGWEPKSVSPAEGKVTVTAGTCATVTFTNRRRPPPGELTLTHVPTPLIVPSGGIATYTLTVRNISTVTVQDVQVAAFLPEGLAFLSAESGGLWNGQRVLWKIPSLSAGQWKALEVAVRVPASVPVGLPIQSLATATVETSAGPFSITTPAVITIGGLSRSEGCLRILESPDPGGGSGPPPPFPFTVTRTGGGQPLRLSTDGNGIATLLGLPGGTYSVTALETPGWNLIPPAPREKSVAVKADAPCASVAFRHSPAAGEPSFAIVLSDGQETAKPGQPLSYSLVLRNVSAADAVVPVRVQSVLPPFLLLHPSTVAGQVFGPGSSDGPIPVTPSVDWTTRAVTWEMPRLPTGAFAILSFDAGADPAAAHGTVIGTLAEVLYEGIVGGFALDTTVVETPGAGEGCIRIVKKSIDTLGKELSWMPPSLFLIDGNQSDIEKTNTYGISVVDAVPVGSHTVIEMGPPGGLDEWKLAYALPTGGTVTVVPNQCTTVTFVNTQVTVEPGRCGDNICASWKGETCNTCMADCGACMSSASSDSSDSSESFSSASSASLASSASSSNPPDLWCDHRLINPPPPACPLYDPAVHTLAYGTVMFQPPYAPSATENPYDIASPIDCAGVCERSKKIGMCCIPSTGCVEMKDTVCADFGSMFFPYGDAPRCDPAFRKALCAGPP